MTHRRYAEVRAPGVLFFFRDQAAASGEEPRYTEKEKEKDKNKDKDKFESIAGELMHIKLKLAVTIEVVQKTGKDSSVHLMIELAEETLDLKVQAQGERTPLEEAERWKTLLLQWKDYSIDHGERKAERKRERERERETVCVCIAS
jgi:hypothetical protein